MYCLYAFLDSSGGSIVLITHRYFVSLLIFVRSAFRVVEFLQGLLYTRTISTRAHQAVIRVIGKAYVPRGVSLHLRRNVDVFSDGRAEHRPPERA